MLTRSLAAAATVAAAAALPASAHAGDALLTSLHAGPVAAAPAQPPASDPCLQYPSHFARTEIGNVPSDWCAAFELDGQTDGAVVDLELPEGTALTLMAGAACGTAAACPAQSQVGVLSVRSQSAAGTIEEARALVIQDSRTLRALPAPEAPPASDLSIELDGGPFGGQLLRLPLPSSWRETDAGRLRVEPRAVALRLWGARPQTGGLTLGACDAAHRTRLTLRSPTPGAPATPATALVDQYLLTRCGTRERTALALQAELRDGRLPPILPYFATQLAGQQRRGGPIGSLSAVLVPELEIGTEIQASVTGGARRARPRRATAGASASAALRWTPPLRITAATRLTLVASHPGAVTSRQTFRFVHRDAALRAQRIAPSP